MERDRGGGHQLIGQCAVDDAGSGQPADGGGHGLAHTVGRLARRGGEGDRWPPALSGLRQEGGGQHPGHRVRLTRPRPAGDDRDSLAQSPKGGQPLAVGAAPRPGETHFTGAAGHRAVRLAEEKVEQVLVGCIVEGREPGAVGIVPVPTAAAKFLGDLQLVEPQALQVEPAPVPHQGEQGLAVTAFGVGHER